MATAQKPTIELADALVMTPPDWADWLLPAPLVIGFLFGALCLMTRKNTARQPYIALAGLGLMLAADIGLFWHVLTNGTAVMTMGRWLPPFGITFAADMMGAIFALVTGIVGLAAGIYAIQDMNATGMRYGFFPFLLLMLAGVTSAFVTGDLFNLYVWFEVLLIGSFGLLVLGSEKPQLDGALKYAFLNLVATTLFLIGVAYVYGYTGTLNMADIARTIAADANGGLPLAVAVLLLFAFMMKAAAFPLNFWLPASYHTPRTVVSGVFAGLLTKVGVYALLRIFFTLFPESGQSLDMVVGIIAILTMIIGAMGAIAQSDIRRLMGYLVISGIGVMLAGMALGTPAGLSGAIFYAGHSMVVMTALYFLTGLMGAYTRLFDLNRLGGLYQSVPGMAVVAFVLALAVSGLPPFSGLWPKLMLVKASLDVGHCWLAGAILLAGFLTTIAVMRMFAFAFWRDVPAGVEMPDRPTGMRAAWLPTVALTGIAVVAGLYPEPVIRIADRAANDLLSQQSYVEAVFGAPAPAEDAPAATEEAQ